MPNRADAAQVQERCNIPYRVVNTELEIESEKNAHRLLSVLTTDVVGQSLKVVSLPLRRRSVVWTLTTVF